VSARVALWVGTTKGLFLFTSGVDRREWQLQAPQLSGWEVTALHAAGAGRRLAGTVHLAYGATLRASDDLGATWRQLVGSPRYPHGSGRTVRRIWRVAEGGPAAPDLLYAGVDEAGLFASRDGGESWALHAGFDRIDRTGWKAGAAGLALHSIVPDPVDAGRLWVAVAGAGLFRTEDGGETWEPCCQGLPGEPADGPAHVRRGVTRLLSHGGTLYARHHHGLHRSEDGGTTWDACDQSLPSEFGFPLVSTSSGDLFTAAMDLETRCFVDGRAGLYRRKAGAARWEPVREGLPTTPHFVGVLRDAVAVDPLEPAGVYFGTTQGDLFASADGGDTWSRLRGQFSRVTCLNACLID
jgi:photosystem II stability/assembly factor-like uncharacterized protein